MRVARECLNLLGRYAEQVVVRFVHAAVAGERLASLTSTMAAQGSL
jgi:hypothetical protein